MKRKLILSGSGLLSLVLFLRGLMTAPIPTITAALILLLLLVVFSLMKVC